MGTQFGKTLDSGIKEFKNRAKKGKITGDDAFVLFSSYGFPIDLTELMGEELKVEVDKVGFEEKMENARNESRKKGAFKKTKDMQLKAAETDALMKSMKVAVTDDSLKYTWDTEGD